MKQSSIQTSNAKTSHDILKFIAAQDFAPGVDALVKEIVTNFLMQVQNNIINFFSGIFQRYFHTEHTFLALFL